MQEAFFQNSSLITYSTDSFERKKIKEVSEVQLNHDPKVIQWFNTYGMDYQKECFRIVREQNLDDFLIKLLSDNEHTNKVIQLENIEFVAIRVLKTDSKKFDSEQMMFVVGPYFLWSIQEKPGDYFGWIRERLELNKGLVRKKNADYLFFLVLESIIDNYQETYERFITVDDQTLQLSEVKPTPEFTAQVEQRKQYLLNFKKAALSLRDTLIKMEKVELKGFKNNYFSEIKEQASNLITDIDFELQELESKINLIFSIQGHRLNEVMKTLTIFSVIFIPLTFMAGIYGMNFTHIPELEHKNGYYILLAVMGIITLISVWYFRRKKWF